MAAKGRMSSKKKERFFSREFLGDFFFSFPFLGGGGEGGNRVDVGRMKKIIFFLLLLSLLALFDFCFWGKVSFLSFFFQSSFVTG